MIFQIGDIIESVFWMGRGYDGEKIIRTGPYRIIIRSENEPAPRYIDEINEVENPLMPPPNFSFVVVPDHIPLGKERETDRCYLNNYVPSMHKNIMRGAYLGDGDYLIRRGAVNGSQTELF